MAISSLGSSNGYYDSNLAMGFDSEAQYRRYMEDQYMRLQYEQARGQQLGGITARDIYNTGSVVKAKVEPTVPEALRFLNNSGNKILLTGEAS